MKEKIGIEFIITGGTIDSYYDGLQDTVIPGKESILPEALGLVKSYTPFHFNTVTMKDSRDLNDEDLKKVLSAIKESEYQKIIVTHGTYTVADTAKYLRENLSDTDKTIIITGSLVPIKGFSPSDGTFNLGYAVAQAESLGSGIYVAMHAKVFTPEEATKNVSERRFESLD